MPSGSQHNPPDPTPTHVRTLRDRLASDRPYEQQDALREVLAFAARAKLIAFSTAARIEEIGWPPPDSDVAAGMRKALADLIVCLVWEAVWPPEDEMGAMDEPSGSGGDAESSAPENWGYVPPSGRGVRLTPVGAFPLLTAEKVNACGVTMRLPWNQRN